MGVTVVSMTSPIKEHITVLATNLTEHSNYTNIALQNVADKNLTVESGYGNFTGNTSIVGTVTVNSTQGFHKVSYKCFFIHSTLTKRTSGENIEHSAFKMLPYMKSNW